MLPEVGETAECSAAATAGVDVAALLVRDLQAGRPGGELHQLHDLDAVGLSDLLLQPLPLRPAWLALCAPPGTTAAGKPCRSGRTCTAAHLCGRTGEPPADCWPEICRYNTRT